MNDKNQNQNQNQKKREEYKKMLEELLNESLNNNMSDIIDENIEKMKKDYDLGYINDDDFKDLDINFDEFYEEFDFDLELNNEDLPESEQHDIFYEFVEENNLILELDIVNQFDTLMVEENWVSKDKTISLKRFYPYESEIISNINPNMKKKIYNLRLEQVLEEEKYEEAAQIRDIINKI